MREAWTGEVVKNLHIYEISREELANMMGVSKTYVSGVLSGKRKVGERGRMNFQLALNDLIYQRVVGKVEDPEF